MKRTFSQQTGTHNSAKMEHPGLRIVFLFVFGIGTGIFSFFSNAAGALAADPYLICETNEGGPCTSIGNEKLRLKRFSPASTFKIVIAWAALEEQLVASSTSFLCRDSFIFGTPRPLNLHEALVFSSNDYFLELNKKLGKEKLTHYAKASGFFEKELDPKWLKKGLRSADWGGTMLVTIDELHRFTLRLMNGRIGSSTETVQTLQEMIEWPTGTSTLRIFGKTGTFGGAVWFTGWGESDGKRKAVTILWPGHFSIRQRVISRFFEQFGIKWNELFLKVPSFFQ